MTFRPCEACIRDDCAEVCPLWPADEDQPVDQMTGPIGWIITS